MWSRSAEEHRKHQDEFAAFVAKEKHLALMIQARIEAWGPQVAVSQKTYGKTESYNWTQFGDMINNCALGLLDLGVARGEKVGIFSNNQVEWSTADIAAYNIGAATVPIYATCSMENLQYIVTDAKIRVMFVGDAGQYKLVLALKERGCAVEQIVIFDPNVPLQKGCSSISMRDLMNKGGVSKRIPELAERRQHLKSDDLATLIYTSGTTGVPKGVMLTHSNFLAMIFGAGYQQKIDRHDVNLALLPLAHVFERAWTYFILAGGVENFYCHDASLVREMMAAVRPHHMASVPRLWEKVHAAVLNEVDRGSSLKKSLFHWAMKVGGEYHRAKFNHQQVSLELGGRFFLADRLVLRKLRAIFGGRTKEIHVGGAPFSAQIAEFFFNAGILLLQGYGLTECFTITIATSSENKFGTCGQVVPLVELRLNSQGEVEARGPNMMQGYYGKPELTAEVMTSDGWLRTGDIGLIDSDGFVTITDRLKDLIKTSTGKYIAPQAIEKLLKEDLYIDQVAVIGDKRPYICALVVPAWAPLDVYAAENGISYETLEDLLELEQIQGFFKARIASICSHLDGVEQVKRFSLLAQPFSQEADEITPSLKVRRKVVIEHYSEVIEKMYKS